MNDITPKEAIANLNHLYGMVAPDIQRSLDVAIKALERPTGDCISRVALKEAISKVVSEERKEDERWAAGLRYALTLVDNAPTVPIPNEQVAWEQGFEAGLAQGKQDRPQGEWINREAVSNTIFPFWERYECNQCHKFNGYSNFCPNCGADMRRGGAE